MIAISSADSVDVKLICLCGNAKAHLTCGGCRQEGRGRGLLRLHGRVPQGVQA
ncbi:hypothetical protein ACQJBY_063100 [Aegilops geniculata]